VFSLTVSHKKGANLRYASSVANMNIGIAWEEAQPIAKSGGALFSALDIRQRHNI
jgi:hypothetical protein